MKQALIIFILIKTDLWDVESLNKSGHVSGYVKRQVRQKLGLGHKRSAQSARKPSLAEKYYHKT